MYVKQNGTEWKMSASVAHWTGMICGLKNPGSVYDQKDQKLH